jgi:hypothetical protein
MRTAGYVKLGRWMLESPLMRQLPPEWLRLFIAIILSVNWKVGTWWDGSREVEVQPGQMITSREKLSLLANISEQQVRGGLKYFKVASLMAIEATSQYTLITVLDSDIYGASDVRDNQQDDQPGNQKRTNEQPTNNHNQRK